MITIQPNPGGTFDRHYQSFGRPWLVVLWDGIRRIWIVRPRPYR